MPNATTFHADLARLNSALAPWLVTTYSRLMQYGHANGLV